MTEKTLRNLIVDLAERYLGCSCGDKRQKHIVDTYNLWFAENLPRGYTVKYSDKWCQVFVDSISIMAQTIGIVPNECGCYEAVNIAKANGTWRGTNYTPKRADLIYFSWKSGEVNHVGFVTSVEDGKVYTIEGNAENGVCRENVYLLTDTRIIGFCAPDYASECEYIPDPPEGASDFQKDAIGIYTVTTGLYLRKKPSALARIITVLPKDAAVYCNGWTAGTWYYVNYRGNEGFCSSKYLRR